jgi:hypothetical protein
MLCGASQGGFQPVQVIDDLAVFQVSSATSFAFRDTVLTMSVKPNALLRRHRHVGHAADR